jgi:hypothetical protein
MADFKDSNPLTIIGVVLGLFGSGVGIWSQVDTRSQQRQIASLDGQLRQRQDERASTTAERDYLLRVTDKVLAAMDSPSRQRQDVAALLIDTLDDAESQKRLRNALLSASLPEVKQRLEQTIAAEARFAAVVVADQAAQAAGQAVASAPLPGIKTAAERSPGKMAVDIFWCEGPSGAAHKQLADALFDAVGASGQFGRVRLRPLPESVNRRPGYGLVSNVIRYQDSEQTAALRLQKAAPATAGFAVQQVRYNTPDYISAFVCAGPV